MLKMEKEIKPIYESELDLYNQTKNNEVVSLDYFNNIFERLNDVIITLLDTAYTLNNKYKKEIKESIQTHLKLNKPWEELKEYLELILLNLVIDKMGKVINPIIEENKKLTQQADEQGHIPHTD